MPNPAADSSRPSRGVVVALILIVVVGAALRMFHLDAESIWLDEAFSVATARSTLANIVFETSGDFHPPLYFFALYGWFHLTDGSGWSARLLSVLFSLAATLTTYVVGRQLVDRRAGLIAALLVATSTFQVEYAQEARMYALLAWLATLSTFTLVRLSRHHSGETSGGAAQPLISAWWWAYVASTSLLVYTHAYSLFVLTAHALAVIGLRLSQKRAQRFSEAWFTAQLGVCLAFLPWLSTFALQFLTVQRGFWIPAPTWADIADPIVAFAGSDELVGMLVPLAVVGAVRLWRLPRSARQLSPLLMLVLGCALPIVLPFLLSLVSSPVFLPKYTIAASIPFALLVATGLGGLPRLIGAAVLIAVMAYTSTALGEFYSTTRKDDWRGAVRALETAAAPGDPVVFQPFFTEIPWSIYRTRTDLRMAPFEKHAREVTAPTLVSMFDILSGPAPRVWVVMMEYDPRKPVLVERLGQRFVHVDRQRFGHIDVYRAEGPRAMAGPARQTGSRDQ